VRGDRFQHEGCCGVTRAIETMTAEELREEVNFWRQNVACWLGAALQAAESSVNPAVLADYRRWNSPPHRVRELTHVLREALTGEEMFQSCEGCAKPVKPGQLVVTFEDVGEMHAECAGAPADQLYVGGRIPVPLESLELEPGEEPPADPAMHVHASQDLYTPDRIERFVAEGEAFLASPRGRRAA
jgi:hypothetical protein